MDDLSLVTPDDIIDREVAIAAGLRDRWAKYLDQLRAGRIMRMRIGERWETAAEAELRLEGVVKHHTRTIELLESFRSSFPSRDD